MIDRTDGDSLRSGFLASASARPDAPALVIRGTIRSYGELERTARRWAGAIINQIDRRPSRVGVFGYRSATSYTGTLAALMGGATFVPLNPTFPIEKTASMIRQAALDAIIVDNMCAAQMEKLVPGIHPAPLLLTPDFDTSCVPGFYGRIVDRTALAQAAPLSELPPLVPEDIAYLLFTSGSTGEPKGVPVTHGNARHFMNVMADRYNVTPDDRFSQTFDQTFDLSIFDLFLAWQCGACVYAMSNVELLSPVGFINRNALTIWFSVPSVPAQMRKRRNLLPSTMTTLRWSLFCGEPLAQASAQEWQEAAPNSIIENLYGPTELTIACFAYRWDRQVSPGLCRHGVVPIGRPLPGLACLVVDEELQGVADGTQGELCVTRPANNTWLLE